VRVFCLSLMALLTGCSWNLRVGDQAFAEARYGVAAQAYEHVWKPNADAALFRLALVYGASSNPDANPTRARQLLETLAERFPTTPYGVAARLMVERLRQEETLEARLHTVNDELAQIRSSVARLEAQRLEDAQAHEAAVTKLQQEGDLLTAQIKQLKEEHAELVLLRQEHLGAEELRAENAHLHEELEEMKRIDLRR